MKYIADAQSLFTFAFDLTRDGSVVGFVQHRLFGRRGTVRVGDVEYDVVRTGLGAWALEITGVPGTIVSADRPGPMRSRFRIRWDGGSIDVVRSGFGYRMKLMRDSAEVGSVRLANFFTRRLLMEVPEDMPVAAVGLLTWLVVRMRRAAAAAAAGGS